MSSPNCHFFKHQKRISSTKLQSFLPNLAKGNHGLCKKGGHTFHSGDIYGSLLPAHCLTFHQIFGFKSDHRPDNTGVCCLFFLVVEQGCPGTALSEILFHGGDANEPDNLCLGCIWVMAANLLVSAPSWARESTNSFESIMSQGQKNFFVLPQFKKL